MNLIISLLSHPIRNSSSYWENKSAWNHTIDRVSSKVPLKLITLRGQVTFSNQKGLTCQFRLSCVALSIHTSSAFNFGRLQRKRVKGACKNRTPHVPCKELMIWELQISAYIVRNHGPMWMNQWKWCGGNTHHCYGFMFIFIYGYFSKCLQWCKKKLYSSKDLTLIPSYPNTRLSTALCD